MWKRHVHLSQRVHSVHENQVNLFISERAEGNEKERERNISVWLSLMRPLLGTWPATQARALTRDQTSDLLVRRLALVH